MSEVTQNKSNLQGLSIKIMFAVLYLAIVVYFFYNCGSNVSLQDVKPTKWGIFPRKYQCPFYLNYNMQLVVVY